MYCNRLHAWWSIQSRLATLLSFITARRWVRLQTLWWFPLKDLSIDEMVGAWCFGCCQAHWGLPVWFLLLRYSVLFTVESLSLLYLLVISWFICSRTWCMAKLGVFHANKTSICLVFVMLSCLFIAALWSPEGKGLTSWLKFVTFIVILLLSHLVSWDRCGTWLYWYLIFAVFLTL